MNRDLFGHADPHPKTATPMLRSSSDDQSDIIASIISLHCPHGIDADITYGNGGFYSKIQEPNHKFDIDPQKEGVIKADSTNLPVSDGAFRSVMFDPPFITYVKNGRDHNCLMAQKFSGYYTYEELQDHYIHTISEAWRVLGKGGILIFKCQDIVHKHKLRSTHVFVCNRAEIEGFRVLDLFVLTAKKRMPGPQKGTQRHARVFQSFFWVFKKPGKPQKESAT
jgi:hypothetical protein